jgi:STE24 endopeptidase
MLRAIRLVVFCVPFLSILGFAQTDRAQPQRQQSAAIESSRAFDIDAAVNAYLAKMPPARRARSDAYFEGGYWLLLWDFLVTAFVMWLLLQFRWSAKMRNLAERITRFRTLQTVLYWLQFIIVTSVVTFPMTVYEGFLREHKYDLMNQTFGAWMRDQAIGLAVSLLLGAILMVPLFGLVRKLGKNWWVWGAVLMIVFFTFVSLIAPVYIAPLFNR